MNAPLTLFDRLWQSHVITMREDGEALLWVDRHFVHEGSHHAFRQIASKGRTVAEPALTFGIADHYVPTRRRPYFANADTERMVEQLNANAAQYGFRHFGLGDPAQGIVHVVGPEQGLTLPGLLVVCGDSHTTTHGALGAYAFGIGASEVAHVLMTQTLWQRKPKQMRISVSGRLGRHVSAKDLALQLIAHIGADGARGHAVEYTGDAIAALPVEGRLTLCNMSIEAGARCAVIAPDAVTFEWIAGRPAAPTGDAWHQAVAEWRLLRSDPDATFDREVSIDAAQAAPAVTWGVSPEDAVAVTGRVPDPATVPPARAAYVREALAYMGLTPGMAVDEITVDRVFIGSCTNARLDDLRAAAAVLRGRRALVPGLVSPGSSEIKRAAEREGIDQIFVAAGLEWAESGCSMCIGMNGDLLRPGERCASTTNRNFRGRQGPGARTHIMSPAMAAAAAVTGHLTDVRELPQLKG
jgi:3-isopropylmalate/(R)-2-methylmalate dehydratase large subunit